MAQTNQAAEPSMEDILASIRRIISEDDNSVAEPETADIANTNSELEQNQAEFTANIATQAPIEQSINDAAANEFEASLDAEDAQIAEAVAQTIGQTMFVEALDQDPEPMMLDEPLELTNEIGLETIEASIEAIESLPTHDLPSEFTEPPAVAFDDHSMALPQSGLLDRTTDLAIAATFKDLEQALAAENRSLPEMTDLVLKPLIKTWLDDNLPQMVERLVREEIQRVARG